MSKSRSHPRQTVARLAVALGIIGAAGATVALLATESGPQVPSVTGASTVAPSGVSSAGVSPSVIEPYVPTTTAP